MQSDHLRLSYRELFICGLLCFSCGSRSGLIEPSPRDHDAGVVVPADAAPVDRTTYCEQTSIRSCNVLASCCGDQFSAEKCSAGLTHYCEKRSEDLIAHGRTFSEQMAGACLQSLAPPKSCSELGVAPDPKKAGSSPCDSIWGNGVAVGGACDDDLDCTFGELGLTVCDGDPARCREAKVGGLGGAWVWMCLFGM